MTTKGKLRMGLSQIYVPMNKYDINPIRPTDNTQ